MSQATAEAPNADQITFWNEVQGDKWVRLQDRTDAALEPMGNAAIDRLDPRPGEHVLDIGCGCGTTSMEIAKRVSPGGAVTAADISEIVIPAPPNASRIRATPAALGAFSADIVNPLPNVSS